MNNEEGKDSKEGTTNNESKSEAKTNQKEERGKEKIEREGKGKGKGKGGKFPKTEAEKKTGSQYLMIFECDVADLGL